MNVRLSLTKSDGTPLETTLEGYGRGSSFDINLEPNGSAFLETDGSGPLTVGAATVAGSGSVGAFGIFSVFDRLGRFQTEAGVQSDGGTFEDFTLPVDVTGSFDTGVALFNPHDTPVEFTLRLLAADGEVVEPYRKLSLPPKHHMARFVSELFPGTANLRGSLAVHAPGLSPLTLRQNAFPLSYTTLPIRPGTSDGKFPPVLKGTRTDISATSDLVVNAALTTGFKLTGVIQRSSNLAEASIAAQSAAGEIYAGRIKRSGPEKYSFALPPGTYILRACYEQGTGTIAYADPNPTSTLYGS